MFGIDIMQIVFPCAIVLSFVYCLMQFAYHFVLYALPGLWLGFVLKLETWQEKVRYGGGLALLLVAGYVLVRFVLFRNCDMSFYHLIQTNLPTWTKGYQYVLTVVLAIPSMYKAFDKIGWKALLWQYGVAAVSFVVANFGFMLYYA
jgi:hypothetical protein